MSKDTVLTFEKFFQLAMGFATGEEGPYPWQRELAHHGLPEVLEVPTGLGKTEGVALAWAWRLLVMKIPGEPRHLIYCLPMRVLVRQTVERLEACFKRLSDGGYVPVLRIYTLMGGEIDEEWASVPEKPWILVGTQDQLLSRALNRGYSMSRYEWPVHFGLLNNDCHWVLDETQLMGPGVWTSAQLDWMRKKRFRTIFPCRTTWMSATLGVDFLKTSDRCRDGLDRLNAASHLAMDWSAQIKDSVATNATKERLVRLRDARRPVELLNPPNGKKAPPLPEWLAERINREHQRGTLTLVICNTIALAQRVFNSINNTINSTPCVLLTSEFRVEDRRQSENVLHQFEARRRQSPGVPLSDDPGLICVSTQVVEAGIDVSARRLFSEIAPWPSILQRLGRLNRDGMEKDPKALFWPWEKPGKGEKRAGPYLLEQLELGRNLLEKYASAAAAQPASAALEGLRCDPQLQKALASERHPYPRAFEVHGLFATEPDVHGGFTDVSQFVRGSDSQADVTVFWRDWDGARPPVGLDGPPFDPDEGCTVALWKFRDFLRENKGWLWDERRGQWEAVTAEDVRPGMVLMLPGAMGGYSKSLGWTGSASDILDSLPPPGPGRRFDEEVLSETGYWTSIQDHLADAKREAEGLVNALNIDFALKDAVVQAAAYHDLGKAHPSWQQKLPAKRGGQLLAKCPYVLVIEVIPGYQKAVEAQINARVNRAQLLSGGGGNPAESIQLQWALSAKLKREELEKLRRLPGVKRVWHSSFRPNMRHEAATALALLHRYWDEKPWPALTVYLAAAHHGKVRTVLRSLDETGQDVFGIPPEPPSIEVGGEVWPMDFDAAEDGLRGRWTHDGFEAEGGGWTGLVVDLLGPWSPDGEPWDTGTVPDGEPRELGPFVLAYLEALVRIADWRASDNPSRPTYPDPPSERGRSDE